MLTCVLRGSNFQEILSQNMYKDERTRERVSNAQTCLSQQLFLIDDVNRETTVIVVTVRRNNRYFHQLFFKSNWNLISDSI